MIVRMAKFSGKTANLWSALILAARGGSRRLLRSRLMRSVLVLSGGTAFAQAVTILSTPIITRLYSPEAFGALGIFVSVIAVARPVSTLGFNYAIPITERDDDAKTLLQGCIQIAFALSIIIGLISYFGRGWTTDALGFQASSWYLMLLGPAVFFVGVHLAASHWLIRFREFHRLAVAASSHSMVANLLKIFGGFFSPVAGSLIVASTVAHFGQSVLVWTYGRRSRSRVRIANVNKHRWEKKWRLIRRYLDFPCYRMPQSLLGALSRDLPTVLIAALFGAAPAGWYSLSRRVLQVPSRVVAESVGKVLIPDLADAAHKRRGIRSILFRTTGALAAISVVPFALVSLYAPTLFGYAFGGEWIMGGHYARWLTLWLWTSFCNRACVSAIPILGLQGHYLVYEVLVTIGRVTALLVGAVALSSAISAVILFSLVGAGFNVFLVAYVIIRADSAARPLGFA